MKEKGLLVIVSGPSGAGKGTVVSELIKDTTRQVELLQAWEDTYIVDSPGFTSLTLDFIEAKDLPNYFKEFKKYLNSCKFCDCKHLHEPNCAVKENLGEDISTQRYERYTKLLNEVLEK